MKRLFAIVLGLLVVMVSSVSVVGASASQTVNGTWQIGTIFSSSAHPVGKYCAIEMDDTLNWQGDFVEMSTQHTTVQHFGPCDQPASETFQSRGTFQGNVGGVTGTFEFQIVGIADAQGNVQAPLVILKGAKGLAQLHGLITMTGPLVPGGDYLGHIHIN